MIMTQSLLYQIRQHSDTRGSLLYNNDFDFKDVKRFYHIKLPEEGIIRAFHGHMVEKKYAYILKGEIKIAIIPLTDALHPAKNVEIQTYSLNASNPQILVIPPKNANGIMSMSKDSEIIFYSTLSLEDSLKDDYRFPEDYWGDNIWKK